MADGTEEINDMRAAMEAGLASARAEDWNRAEALLRRAVDLSKDAPEPRYLLGWTLWKHAETVKPSVADWGIGIMAQVTGFDTVARERGRRIRRHRRMLNESAEFLREAIERRSEHADAYYYLARVLKELGRGREATAAAEKASTIQPDNSRFATLAQNYQQEAPAQAYEPRTNGAGARLTWNDLILAPKTKRELRQMQLMLEKPALAHDLGVEPPTGILLKGAPGTGKTTIARVLANEAKCKFFSITPADINQMFVGVSEQRVRDLFARARANAPSIIFIDEIDALLPARQGGVAIHSDKVVNQFLQEMDGMTPNNRVFLVGATNRADMLDPAVRRGGRLSREIEIPLPDRDARLELLTLFTRNVNLADEVDMGELATRTAGYSGADLKAIVNEAGLQALIRIADMGEDQAAKVLTNADFDEALKNLELE